MGARQAYKRHIVIPHVPRHITQRGNNRQDIFFAAADRRAHLELLGERCTAEAVAVLAYGLMSNHVHLIVEPPSEPALARAIGRTHFVYTRYVNRLHGQRTTNARKQAETADCP